MKILLKILGSVAGVAFLLWLGHVRVSGASIGQHVEKWSVAAWTWGVKTISDSEVFGKVKLPTKGIEAQVPSSTPIPDVGEKISAADRESLMKLLQ